MGWLLNSLNSSIGKKFVMAVTGVCLLSFLTVHLIGNMTLYIGKEMFNGYAGMLGRVEPLIRVIEVILALIILLHIYNGVRLWWQNRKAKGINYTINASSKNSTLGSRTMIITGTTILVFLILHLYTVWFKFNFTGAKHEQDLYEMVVSLLRIPWYSALYVIAIGLMFWHLNHGFQSAFQTFGWNHNKYSPLIKALGAIYAFIMFAGFVSIPIYFYFFSGGNS